MSLDKIEDILDDLRQGKMVILMDDENRENEGDLLMAAECVTADDVNFMARYGRGLICLTLTEDHCKKLDLPLMVNNNRTPYATNFTVSIEAAEGVTTGISAADRAKTVLAAVNENVQAEDIITPGHVFPLMAQKGGVLSRAGHTEAGVDLAALAGFQASSVMYSAAVPNARPCRTKRSSRRAASRATASSSVKNSWNSSMTRSVRGRWTVSGFLR